MGVNAFRSAQNSVQQARDLLVESHETKSSYDRTIMIQEAMVLVLLAIHYDLMTISARS